MKRRGMTLLTVLTLVCALCATGAAGAETLAELRTETANGWQETLTDKNGTSVTVNAAIEIRDGAEEVSALRVSAGASIPEDRLDIFDRSWNGQGNENGTLSQLSPAMLTGVDALGAFLGVEPQGRKVPDVTGKGGLSYEAALKTADEIVNHLFGTGMEDYGVSFQLYTVENIETPDLELVSFAKVQETLKAALARTDLYTLMGLSPQETPASIENIRLEYLTFADGKRILLLPAWVMDVFYENEEEEEGPQVNTLCFSAQTGQRLKRKDGLYQPVP